MRYAVQRCRMFCGATHVRVPAVFAMVSASRAEDV